MDGDGATLVVLVFPVVSNRRSRNLGWVGGRVYLSALYRTRVGDVSPAPPPPPPGGRSRGLASVCVARHKRGSSDSKDEMFGSWVGAWSGPRVG